MATARLTPADKATTAIELSPDEARQLAMRLDRLDDPHDAPAASTAAGRIRCALTDQDDEEVALSASELDAIRRVFAFASDERETAQLARLRDELNRWLG